MSTNDNEIVIGTIKSSAGQDIAIRLILGKKVLIDFREFFMSGDEMVFTKKGIRIDTDNLDEVSEAINNVYDAITMNADKEAS